jgi:hypothetical protein
MKCNARGCRSTLNSSSPEQRGMTRIVLARSLDLKTAWTDLPLAAESRGNYDSAVPGMVQVCFIDARTQKTKSQRPALNLLAGGAIFQRHYFHS